MIRWSVLTEESQRFNDITAFESARRIQAKAQVEIQRINYIDPIQFEHFKTYRKPPQSVRAVFGAICAIIKTNETWDEAQFLLSGEQFLDELQKLDVESIPMDRINRVKRNYTNNHRNRQYFDPEEAKKHNLALEALVRWINGIILYK